MQRAIGTDYINGSRRKVLVELVMEIQVMFKDVNVVKARVVRYMYER